MELQHSGLYSMHPTSSKAFLHLQKSSYNMSNGVQSGGGVVLATDRRSTS